MELNRCNWLFSLIPIPWRLIQIVICINNSVLFIVEQQSMVRCIIDYSFIHRRTQKLFPDLGYYKKSSCEYLYTGFYVNIIFIVINAQECNYWSAWLLNIQFYKNCQTICQSGNTIFFFLFLSAMCERSSFSAFFQYLVVLLIFYISHLDKYGDLCELAFWIIGFYTFFCF